jgi:hypothetical protein
MEKMFSEVFAAAYAANMRADRGAHADHMEAIQRASQAAYAAVTKFRELEATIASKSCLSPYRD